MAVNIQNRQKILSTAIHEFAEHGKAGARVDRIAERAGVNKAMIYYHFNSKDNLYAASIAEHITQVAAGLQQRFVPKFAGQQTLEMAKPMQEKSRIKRQATQ